MSGNSSVSRCLREETVDMLESKGKNLQNSNKHHTNFSHVHFKMYSSNHSKAYSQLSYVGQDCWKMPPVLALMYGARVQVLDLSYNCLTSLQGVECFVNLEELVLDNNRLSDTVVVPKLLKLHTLSLNKNNISNLELLLTKVAKNLPALHYLSLLGNVACPNQLSDLEKDEEDYQRYRYYVLHHLPRLNFLDSRRVSLDELKEAQRRGQFMKIVRPELYPVQPRDQKSDHSPPSSYTPLPVSTREVGDHQGAYGGADTVTQGNILKEIDSFRTVICKDHKYQTGILLVETEGLHCIISYIATVYFIAATYLLINVTLLILFQKGLIGGIS